jgi:hypothetical protein
MSLVYEPVNALMMVKSVMLPALQPAIDADPVLRSLADNITCPYQEAGIFYGLPGLGEGYTSSVMRQQTSLAP